MTRMMTQFHLMTCRHNSSVPINHGLVGIDERNFIDGETPVEDFGMFWYRDEPFPESRSEMMQLFISIMSD